MYELSYVNEIFFAYYKYIAIYIITSAAKVGEADHIIIIITSSNSDRV